MKGPGPIRFLSTVVLLLAVLAGCSDEQTPEERVRTFIARMADSAEERSWMAFNSYISDAYADERGLDKDATMAIVTRYILANQSIHVLERVPVVEVEIPAPMRATAVVYAALAGQPITGVEDLSRITADVYRFEIDLAENAAGDLEVTRGNWRPAPISDFLIGI